MPQKGNGSQLIANTIQEDTVMLAMKAPRLKGCHQQSLQRLQVREVVPDRQVGKGLPIAKQPSVKITGREGGRRKKGGWPKGVSLPLTGIQTAQ